MRENGVADQIESWGNTHSAFLHLAGCCGLEWGVGDCRGLVRNEKHPVDRGNARDMDRSGPAGRRVVLRHRRIQQARKNHMPTYEYTCQKCGHHFECVQSMKAAPLETCPHDQCPKPRWAKGKVQRGIGGGAGLIFKGSGFYITDYRSEGYKASAKADSGAKPAGDSKPAAESKPAPAASAPAPAAPPSGSKPRTSKDKS